MGGSERAVFTRINVFFLSAREHSSGTVCTVFFHGLYEATAPAPPPPIFPSPLRFPPFCWRGRTGEGEGAKEGGRRGERAAFLHPLNWLSSSHTMALVAFLYVIMWSQVTTREAGMGLRSAGDRRGGTGGGLLGSPSRWPPEIKRCWKPPSAPPPTPSARKTAPPPGWGARETWVLKIRAGRSGSTKGTECGPSLPPWIPLRRRRLQLGVQQPSVSSSANAPLLAAQGCLRALLPCGGWRGDRREGEVGEERRGDPGA